MKREQQNTRQRLTAQEKQQRREIFAGSADWLNSRLHAAGLNVWTGFRAKPTPDQTFYLEDKRNR